MAYERRDIRGGAIETTLNGGISSGATSFVLTSSTGWPDGSAGAFLVAIDRPVDGQTNASYEKILCASRTGTTVTVTTRGYDDTSAAAHSSGARVEHIFGDVDLDEANYTVAETVGKITGAGELLIGDGANSLAALDVKTSGRIIVGNGTTAASVAVSGDATLASSGALTLAANSVDSAEITAGAIDLAHMSANSVDSDQYVDGSIDLAHLSANSVDSSQIVAGAVDLAHMSANSVDSDQYVDGSIDTAHIGDGQVTPAKLEATAWSSYEPSFTQNATITKTVNYAKSIQLGKLVIVNVKITASSAGNAGNVIRVGLPVTAATSGSLAVGAGYVSDASPAFSAALVPYLATTGVVEFVHNDSGTELGSGGFTVASGDVLSFQVSYEAA